MAELNDLLVGYDLADDHRRIGNRTMSIGAHFELEADLLRPLPAEVFETGLKLTPRVNRYAQITVRQCHYSVPAHLIGHRVRAVLRASELLLFAMTTTRTTTRTATSNGPRGTGRPPSEQAIDAAIDGASRLLRLPTLRDRYAEIADAASREQLSYRAFLAELLLAECNDRDARRAVRRVHEAGVPDFDFNANTAINPATINTLAGGGSITKGQSLCLSGDSGTGTSHLLIGLGTAAAHQGHRVRYVLAANLVNELVEAADERQLSRTIARYPGLSWAPSRARRERQAPCGSPWTPAVRAWP